jgi:sulfate adenylyltransferase subunit 2
VDDTGHNFPETIEFRDRLVKELGPENRSMYKMPLTKEKLKKLKYSSRNSCKKQHSLDIEEFLMLVLVYCRDEEKQELKNVFFLFVMILVNGRKPTSRIV